MDEKEQEKLVRRIISGSFRFKRDGQWYAIKSGDPDIFYMGELIYEEAYQQAKDNGSYEEHDLLKYMQHNKFWTDKQENRLRLLPQQINSTKIQLFESPQKRGKDSEHRKKLRKLYEEIETLTQLRHRYDYLSCHGHGEIIKNKFLIACTLYKGNNSVFNLVDISDFLELESHLIDYATNEYAKFSINATTYRLLARNPYWRQLWDCRKSGDSLFGKPISHYSLEQQHLVKYATWYDNIYEHPECPNNEVIEDDDRLDGWLLKQSKQEGDKKVAHSDKINNAQNIFVVADNDDEAREVNEWNDDVNKARKQYFTEKLSKEGEVRYEAPGD